MTTYGSAAQMKKALLEGVKEEVRRKLKDMVTEAVKEASEKVAADMMVMLGEMLTVQLAERAGCPGHIEVHIIYQGLDR